MPRRLSPHLCTNLQRERWRSMTTTTIAVTMISVLPNRKAVAAAQRLLTVDLRHRQVALLNSRLRKPRFIAFTAVM